MTTIDVQVDRDHVPVRGSVQSQTMFGRHLLFGLGLSLPLLAAVTTTPVVTRILGPTAYGQFATDLALQQITFCLAALGLHIAVIRVFSRYGVHQARVVLTWSIPTAATLTALLLVSAPVWSGLLGSHHIGTDAVLTVVWSGLTGVTWVGLAIQRCQDRLLLFAGTNLVQCLGTQVVGLALALWLGRSVTHVLVGCVVAQGASLGIVLVTTRPARPALGQVRFVAGAVGFGLALLPQQIAGFVINTSDRFVVRRDLGAAMTGRYQVAYNVAAVGLLLTTYLSQAWLPKILSTSDEQERRQLLSETWRSLDRILLCGVLVIAFAGPPALDLWVPPSFRPEGLVMVVLLVAVGTIPYAKAMMSMNDLVAGGRTAPVAISFFMASAMNVALNLELTPRLGLNGSALSTLCSFLFLAAILGLFTARHGTRPGKFESPAAGRLLIFVVVSAIALGTWCVPDRGIWMGLRIGAAVVAGSAGIQALRNARRITNRPETNVSEETVVEPC